MTNKVYKERILELQRKILISNRKSTNEAFFVLGLVLALIILFLLFAYTSIMYSTIDYKI